MKYKSKYSPGKLVTGHQYIVELVCEFNAKKLGRELPMHFWNFQEWRTYYVVQSKYCSELRELFCDEAILRAVKEKRLYNLRPNWIRDIIAKHEAIIQKEKSVVKKVEEYVEQPTFKVNENKPSILDILDE
jgi:hypothetical protein